ncbi:MAG TPA: hypothetical protein VEB87_01780 [Nitrososphaerales archaeon]|nr:hypothetical protein [Nitrososphaerales archaeon]
MPGYNLWAQVAGYFDGDGTIYFSDTTNQPYKLSVSLVFVDQSYDQVKNIRDFLRSRNIRTSNILKRSDAGAYELAVSEFNSVKETLRQMLPYLCKKANEASAALEYYDGKITGNELSSVFEGEVEAGRRERKSKKVRINTPYLRPVGDRMMKTLRNDRLRDAFGRYRAKVTPGDYAQIRMKYFEQGMRVRDLVKEYPQYARETIRRVLGGGRGYVGVKGVGRVETTDSR